MSKAVEYLRFNTKEQLSDYKKQHLKDLSVFQEKIFRKLADKEADATTKAVEEYFKAKEQN